ncbi:MAG: flippase-like domain-containing protein [Ignavibacteriales bacterium]|nr:flippase-like domain-containing protein [Ignavibacteriales bacterium]
MSVFLMVLFLYFAFRGTDWNALKESLRTANYWWMLVMFLILIVSHLVRAYRWKYFLAPIKSNIRFSNLFSSLMIGYMVNNFLPRGGEIVRPYTLGKLEGISRSSAFGTVVMERFIDFLSFIILVALIPLVYSGPLTEKFPWLIETSVIASVVTFAGLGSIIFLMFKREYVFRLLEKITKRFSQQTSEKIHRIAHSFLDGFLFIKTTEHYFAIILSSILVWLLYILMTFVAFFSFQELRALDFGSALVLQAISSIGIAIPTPGGTGSYHLITIQTLTKLYAVNETVARSYATLTHAVGYLGVIVVGLYYFVHDHLRVSEVLHEAEEAKET